MSTTRRQGQGEHNTYVNRPETSTVSSCHVLVQRLDGIRTRQLAEFLVHVVRARTGIVTQPDAKVLDFQRFLLVDLEIKKNARAKGMRGFGDPLAIPFRLPLERLQGIHTTLTPMISPLAFLTFFNCLTNVQIDIEQEANLFWGHT